MAMEYIRIEEQMKRGFLLKDKLWLTADQKTVVPDGHPDAAFLLGTPGKKVPHQQALDLGLIDEDGNPQVLDLGQGGDEEYYEDMTVARLQDIIRERDLPVSGNKDELIARLVEDDESSTDDDDDDEDGD